jgi:hypothetical protein
MIYNTINVSQLYWTGNYEADGVATWDTPPPVNHKKLYDAYKDALRRYLRDRKVIIPILDEKQCERREIKAEKFTRPPSTQPKCIVGGVSCLTHDPSEADESRL